MTKLEPAPPSKTEEDDPVAWTQAPERPVESTIPDTPESLARDKALNDFIGRSFIGSILRGIFR